jgi:uncharacterized protein (TIGR03437 family)
MGSPATVRRLIATVLPALFLAIPSNSFGQAAQPQPEWNHIGNSLLNLSLADLATGPVKRVWYSADGGTLYANTALGKTYETSDFETWKASTTVPTAPQDTAGGIRLPEPGAQVRGQYAFGQFVYRTQTLGASWDNLTAFRSRSIIGSPLDVASSPRDSEEVTVASSAGVFRSLDGGKSWSGLNEGLPNFPGPGAKLRSLPSGVRGVQLELEGGGIVEWQPGEKQAWAPALNGAALSDTKLRADLEARWGTQVTALRREGNTVYAGTADGRIRVSTDGMTTWQTSPQASSAPVAGFWVNSQEPRTALAVLGSGLGSGQARILRTLTLGNSWDDLTTNLPELAAHGITASGTAMYVATDQGVFYTLNGPQVPAGIGIWQKLNGLPEAPATDVRLDAAGNQLWAAVEGYGVYLTPAPHRLGEPQIVSSADLSLRAAAPGALMSVTGTRVVAAQAGNLPVSILKAGEAESQIQIPFEARGDSVSLSTSEPAGGRAFNFSIPLESVSPGIFVELDGSPVVFDAASGGLLDASNPARSRTRIQVMASGLGRVSPDWRAGVEAPLDNPPKVVADVRALLDGAPMTVTRAVLAPGYVGWYLVEIEIPAIVNTGASELYLDVDGHASNRVRVYIEP